MTDSKFEKSSRLLSVSDFANLKIASLVFKKASLIVYYKENSLSNARIGFSVSKKVGNSPVRNRIKRILRESFRHSQIRHLNFDILFVVSFTKSLVNECLEKKEEVLLNHSNDFFNYLAMKK